MSKTKTTSPPASRPAGSRKPRPGRLPLGARRARCNALSAICAPKPEYRLTYCGPNSSDTPPKSGPPRQPPFNAPGPEYASFSLPFWQAAGNLGVAQGRRALQPIRRRRLPVTVHGPGTGLLFGPFRDEKCACPLPARWGQSHFRGLRRENRASPRERLRIPRPRENGSG